MNIPVGALTIGGLFTGLAIPTWHVSRFAFAHLKNRSQILRDAKALLPLAAGMGYGGLATATSSGLIGGVTGVITWLGNGAGSLAMWGAVGGTTTLPARSNLTDLSGPGTLVLMLITVVVIASWKVIPKEVKPQTSQGMVAGVLLGLSATLGGWFAAWVIPAVNGWGDGLIGGIA